MPNDLHDYIICQAICDSLTLRSATYQYFMYEQYGIHYVACADRINKTVQLLDHALSYNEMVEILVQILEEEISNA